jgi:transposase
MRRGIGIDIQRTFGAVVIWEDGRLRSFGRVDMTRTALEGLGGKLHPTDEVVIEATGASMVLRVLSPFVQRVVQRVVIANPLQGKAIAHAHVKKRQGRRRDAGEPVRGRVSAGDLDP